MYNFNFIVTVKLRFLKYLVSESAGNVTDEAPVENSLENENITEKKRMKPMKKFKKCKFPSLDESKETDSSVKKKRKLANSAGGTGISFLNDFKTC